MCKNNKSKVQSPTSPGQFTSPLYTDDCKEDKSAVEVIGKSSLFSTLSTGFEQNNNNNFIII